uniref:Uncharacterized protein n=1 Tax=Leptocylindrus danicus TaxID=163516 RepID=A0A7S2JPQ9_9STRA|mmetsp:Transcript_10144/g.15208  ORF Transcript_10144/g.15208 Transcript_10144/m.15208 type:complete len:445 (+) Transcript_10144:228-1562(+)|eukprot:CAMPEP_0116020666 /NCGR_PEP_ID=MMETSP0321-20121206/9934_1 /TAXON_ID=163516 /ORGANISM="Leptocylindrus danicus var. danicus, Strain B650" /LENGTH=444 /DNA_ID=CAMNT_0003491403 /DNA_START=154 /DNA_END=1488 /DNA_ORIENTATION=+
MSTGFSNKYDKWNSVANELVSQTEEEDKADEEQAADFLGLKGKVPRSQAEADEKAKLEASRKLKEALDRQKEMEEKKKLVIEDVVGSNEGETMLLNDAKLQGRRVIVLRKCSKLEVHLTAPSKQSDSIIKVFLEECENLNLKVEAPIVTSMVEITHCKKVEIKVCKYRLSTLQIDMSKDLLVEYTDLNCFGLPSSDVHNGDRIYHAGVSDMVLKVPVFCARTKKASVLERKIDYIADGAIRVAEQSAQEYQFVTYVDRSSETIALVTERLHRVGTREFTDSELEKKRLEGNERDVELYMQDDERKIKECETHKAEGNEEFKNGNYTQAVLMYSMAIEKSSCLDKSRPFQSRHICFANRSACFLKIGHHEKALADAESCIQLDQTYIKGFFRKGLALHAMEKYQEALPVLVQSLKFEPKNKQIKQAIKFCEIKLEMEMRKRMNGN